MFGRAKPSISADLRDWIKDSFDWADGQFGASWSLTRLLVTPTKTFFSAPGGQTQAVAQTIANDIGRQIPVREIPVEPLNRLSGEYRHSYQSLGETGGLYLEDDDGALILYDAEMMHRPLAFINTMTHELMHHRLGPFISEMPGGEPAHELSTDLHCITHGFGIFALEGPAQMGWSGYMTQESRAFALAYFLNKHSMDPKDALQWLSARPAKALKRALKEL
ncbi:hypothetical protein SAMN04488515_1236 [Cognatiyoonia koreensis]|uniref:Uncharacterized protein n=1 Tax=Cognatiyoonia koreensis TaxID=364200 RepID=A0A1I0PHW0_9RHOB|nr:hypothetical protein [Cognatiyoonia koreensis]SEW13842.1 hypothetical protein SAMN04488515_1236 [Cognatiyoonia koreensis]